MIKAICKINNKEVKCEIIDGNYNNHAKEVKILEGIHAGRFAIVENYDVITIDQPKTIKSLVKLVSNNIEDKEELKENIFVELVSYDIMKTVEEFSKKIQLSKKDFYTLTDIYGVYNHCGTIEDVKLYLVIDYITKQLDGVKITFTEFKKLQLKK